MNSNLPASYIYSLIPAGVRNEDDNRLIEAVCLGYQDRLSELRAISLQVGQIWDADNLNGLPVPAVVVNYADQGGVPQVTTCSWPYDQPVLEDNSDSLYAWVSSELKIQQESILSAVNTFDSNRTAMCLTLSLLASTLGAVVYPSFLKNSVDSQRQALKSYFPSLKVKGTSKSFSILGKLHGFSDCVATPLWGRLSPRHPSNPGDSLNDADFGVRPQGLPTPGSSTELYDVSILNDGDYYSWNSGILVKDSSQTNYFEYGINGSNPYVSVTPTTSTPALPKDGTYYLSGGAPGLKARVQVGNWLFEAIASGVSFNGLPVQVVSLAAGCYVQISGNLSSIKFRTSFFDVSATALVDSYPYLKPSGVSSDLKSNPGLYTSGQLGKFQAVSFSDSGLASAPYGYWNGGALPMPDANFWNLTQGPIYPYSPGVPGSLNPQGQSYARQGYSANLVALDPVALESAWSTLQGSIKDVKPATRFVRKSTYGFSFSDQVQYAKCSSLWLNSTVTGTLYGNFEPLSPDLILSKIQIGDLSLNMLEAQAEAVSSSPISVSGSGTIFSADATRLKTGMPVRVSGIDFGTPPASVCYVKVVSSSSISLHSSISSAVAASSPYSGLASPLASLTPSQVYLVSNLNSSGFISLDTGAYSFSQGCSIKAFVATLGFDSICQEPLQANQAQVSQFSINLANLSMVVSGAGVSSCNGVYTLAGTINGKNYYNGPSGHSIIWYVTGGGARYWTLKTSSSFYASYSDTATPDLATGWFSTDPSGNPNTANNPVPKVLSYSSGDVLVSGTPVGFRQIIPATFKVVGNSASMLSPGIYAQTDASASFTQTVSLSGGTGSGATASVTLFSPTNYFNSPEQYGNENWVFKSRPEDEFGTLAERQFDGNYAEQPVLTGGGYLVSAGNFETLGAYSYVIDQSAEVVGEDGLRYYVTGAGNDSRGYASLIKKDPGSDAGSQANGFDSFGNVYSVGSVFGNLLADTDHQWGPAQKSGLVCWYTFSEHPEQPYRLKDSVFDYRLTQVDFELGAYRSNYTLGSRIWDDSRGWNLALNSSTGSLAPESLAVKKDRAMSLSQGVTFGFWVKPLTYSDYSNKEVFNFGAFSLKLSALGDTVTLIPEYGGVSIPTPEALQTCQLQSFAYHGISYVPISSGNWKDTITVAACAAADVARKGLQSVDGVVLKTGDYVLITGQNDRSENGCYVAAETNWYRYQFLDQVSESGQVYFAKSGSANSGYWVCRSQGIVYGSSQLVYSKVTGAVYGSWSSPLQLLSNPFWPKSQGLTGSPLVIQASWATSPNPGDFVVSDSGLARIVGVDSSSIKVIGEVSGRAFISCAVNYAEPDFTSFSFSGVNFKGVGRVGFSDFRIWNECKLPSAWNSVVSPTFIPSALKGVAIPTTYLQPNSGYKTFQVLSSGKVFPSVIPQGTHLAKELRTVVYTGKGEYQGPQCYKEVGLGEGISVSQPAALGTQGLPVDAYGWGKTSGLAPDFGQSYIYVTGPIVPGQNGGQAEIYAVSLAIDCSTGSEVPSLVAEPAPVGLITSKTSNALVFEDGLGNAVAQSTASGTRSLLYFTVNRAAFAVQERLTKTTTRVQTGTNCLAIQAGANGTFYPAVVHAANSANSSAWLYSRIKTFLSGTLSSSSPNWPQENKTALGLLTGYPSLQGVGTLEWRSSTTLPAGKYVVSAQLLTQGDLQEFSGYQVSLGLSNSLMADAAQTQGQAYAKISLKYGIQSATTRSFNPLCSLRASDSNQLWSASFEEILADLGTVELKGSSGIKLNVGTLYTIISYSQGDDFSNVGGSNASGATFRATGTTPASWSNSIVQAPIACISDSDASSVAGPWFVKYNVLDAIPDLSIDGTSGLTGKNTSWRQGKLPLNPSDTSTGAQEIHRLVFSYPSVSTIIEVTQSSNPWSAILAWNNATSGSNLVLYSLSVGLFQSSLYQVQVTSSTLWSITPAAGKTKDYAGQDGSISTVQESLVPAQGESLGDATSSSYFIANLLTGSTVERSESISVASANISPNDSSDPTLPQITGVRVLEVSYLLDSNSEPIIDGSGNPIIT